MKIVVTADFHGIYPPEIPECDLLLIAGDVGLHDGQDVLRFGEWLLAVPAHAVVGIAGNHDSLAAKLPYLMRGLPWTYLQDQSVVVDGIKIHGSPWAPEFGMWDFMKPDPELSRKWEKIPDDVGILMTHGPPLGICDLSNFRNENAGSRTLLRELDRLKDLRLHVFGHIHEARGSVRKNGRLFINAAAGFGWYGPVPPGLQIIESEDLWPK